MLCFSPTCLWCTGSICFSAHIWHVIYSSSAYTYLERRSISRFLSRGLVSCPRRQLRQPRRATSALSVSVKEIPLCPADGTKHYWRGLLPVSGWLQLHNSCHALTLRKTPPHTHIKQTQLYSCTFFSPRVSEVAQTVILDLINLRTMNEKQGCFSVFTRTALQGLEKPVAKSYPMSYVNHHNIMQADSE